MKVSKKLLKEAAEFGKSLGNSREKESAQMVIQCMEGGRIICYAKNEYVFSFYELPNLDETAFSFIINPFHLLDSLTGTDKEKEYTLEEREEGLVLVSVEGVSLPVKPYEKDIRLPFGATLPFQDPERFKEVLDAAKTVLEPKAEKPAAAYMKLTPKAAITAHPVCLRLTRLDEAFEFGEGLLHHAQIESVLKVWKGGNKSTEVSFSHASYNGTLILKKEIAASGKRQEADSGCHYLMLKTRHAVAFPEFKDGEIEEEALLAFTVDAGVVNEYLMNIPKGCRDFYLSLEKEQLVLDPKSEDEEVPVLVADMNITFGDFGSYKLDAVAFRRLLLGQTGVTEIKHIVQKRAEKDPLTVWRIYTPDKVVSILGKTEPDYEKVSAHIKEVEQKREIEQERRRQKRPAS